MTFVFWLCVGIVLVAYWAILAMWCKTTQQEVVEILACYCDDE